MGGKVEKFEVEKKSFQVKFEGSNGGTWISITERSRGFVASVGFGKEELDWLMEHLKKAVELEASRGFIRKIRGKTRTHLMEICFNSRGCFMKITEIVTKRKPSILVVPEGVKGNGWEGLRKALYSVQDYSDQAGGVSKKMLGDAQASKSYYRGNRSYAEVVAEDEPRNGDQVSVGKWARAVICECKEKIQDWAYVGKTIAGMMGTRGMVSVTPISAYKGCFFVDSARRAEWFQERGSLLVRGWTIFLRRWSPSENMFVGGKFRRGWLELKGLPFHLWDEEQLKFILKKWGRVTKVARESLKFADLSKVKLWVEICPNVVLPALLEVEDGAWTFTVAVSVTGEDDEVASTMPESNHSNELVNMGGYVSQWTKNAERLRDSTRVNECYSRRPLPRPRYRDSTADNSIGLTVSEPIFKAQLAKAQSGKIGRGLQAGPVDTQAHETVALSSSQRQRDASSARATPMFAHSQGTVEERADDVDFSGKVGRPFEVKAHSLFNPSPPSADIVGSKLKGPSALGRSLKGLKLFAMIDRYREDEDVAASKGKAPEDQSRGYTQKEEVVVSKKMWTTLFPPSFDRRQEIRRRSEPIFPAKPSSVSEARPLEEDLRSGPQLESEGTARPLFRPSPLFRCLLRNRCSGEGTSLTSGDVALRNHHFEENKEGSKGRVGSDLCGFTIMGSPSSPKIRGKGPIFEGFCEFSGVENSEVCLSSPTQPPESFSTPSCGLVLPLPSPSGPDLLSSVSLSQFPMENRVNSEILLDKDDVGTFFQKNVGIPGRDEAVNQFASPHQMSECFTPTKPKLSKHKEVSNLATVSQGDNVVSPSGEFHIDGLSPGKMAKVREVLCSMDIKVYSRRKNRSSTGN
ncbi:hypothetical protein PVL29_023629 [Vitis rotundifolia]|uniref:DUF4283 domain-containing protein n=1 Tax=Vitis rotundifolia TaxID=103349 RepID=A0AA38YPN8_VITRO|nr:hypothetical protein PVL29_023629 [Vitis rotundifolia]